MQTYIEALYGNDFFELPDPGHQRELARLWDKMETLEGQLEQGLPEEQLALFRQYRETQEKCGFLEGRNEFAEGFRLGGRLVMEMLLS